MAQKEDERLRASIRRESQQRRMRERATQRGMSSSYLEGDYDHEDENTISLSAIKKQYKQGTKRMHQLPLSISACNLTLSLSLSLSLSLCLSLSLSLGHFPVGRGLVGTRMFTLWILFGAKDDGRGGDIWSYKTC